MKYDHSKQEAKSIIDEFFKRQNFTKEEMKKIKKLAMKYRIRLGNNRRRFCKRCLSQLQGNIKVTKTHVRLICPKCGAPNRYAISKEIKSS